MDKLAVQLLHKLRPQLANEEVGLSFNIGEHIVYTNEYVVKQLGYKKREEVCHIHPFMLSPEHQPDGELSSTKSILMLKKARVLGEYDFPWVHVKMDKTEVNCHIHLFDLSASETELAQRFDLFAIWQFSVLKVSS